MLNSDLLIDVLAQIEAEPRLWDQTLWGHRTDCGTQYCIAGWACVLSGRKVQWHADRLVDPDGITGRLTDGTRIGDTARQLLGLTEDQATRLFHLPNHLDYVYEDVAAMLDLDEQVLRDKVQAEKLAHG